MSEPNRVLMGHPAWSLRGWWQWRRVTMRPARRSKPVTVSARHVARLIAYADTDAGPRRSTARGGSADQRKNGSSTTTQSSIGPASPS
jgi:hypothetical protein